MLRWLLREGILNANCVNAARQKWRRKKVTKRLEWTWGPRSRGCEPKKNQELQGEIRTHKKVKRLPRESHADKSGFGTSECVEGACIGNSVLEMSRQRSWSRRGACYLWYTDQQRSMHDADFSEIQAWRQVRWIAGVVMSETRDPGIKSPQWHTLMLGGHVQVEITRLQKIKSIYWRKWATKPENAELKEVLWTSSR